LPQTSGSSHQVPLATSREYSSDREA
jgi:hypothetical protein